MPTLTAGIGDRLKKLRTEMGLRQDDLASTARALGFRWSRVTVARLEGGVGQLEAAEFLMLPQVLVMASVTARGQRGLQGLERRVELADLLPVSGMVTLKPDCRVNAGALRAMVEGRYNDVRSTDFDVPLLSTLRRRQAAAVSTLSQHLAQKRELGNALDSVWPEAPAAVKAKAVHEAAGEAEQKAARKLGVHPAIVALAAERLWGQSLTAERDRRVKDRPPEDSPRRLQAIRGHVTRLLITQLSEVIGKRK